MKYGRHSKQKINLSIFATDKDGRLAPELLSRFDTKPYFHLSSFEDFIALCRGYLSRYENLSTDIAEYTGEQTWHQLDKDVRNGKGNSEKA